MVLGELDSNMQKIVEAMKLMNEIESEVSGEIVVAEVREVFS